MCTSVMKQNVQNYLHKTSIVYACMLDVSKAFDKLHFGKLFKLLVDRKIHGMVICLFLDNYTRQNICTTWNGAKSHTFTALNGVCQCHVLLPLSFNIYFYEMIYKLEKSCIGCKIGTHFIDALAYTGSYYIALSQKMINICEQFGIDFQVTFSDKKR